MKRFLAFCLGITLVVTATAQKPPSRLQREVNDLVRDYRGVIGVYAKNLKTGETVSYQADTIFPTASIVKIPILLGVMDKIDKGELSDTQQLVYRDSLLYAGVDILGSFKQDEKIELGKVVMLMLVMSDNTASLWLQSLAGTGTRINQILDSLGFRHTRVNSRTPGREMNRSQFGWGQTTPREMAGLMEAIAMGKIISRERSAQMLRLLSRNYWDRVSISQIPAHVFIASKNGAVDESRSEVLYVRGEKANYVFCVSTKNNADTSWHRDNEAWTVTRKLSRLFWNHFNN